MDNAKSNWEKYVALSDKMLVASRQNKTQEAMNILQGESLTVFDEVSNTCLQVAEFNKEGAELASANGDRLFAFSEVAILVILGLAIVISVFLATYIVKLITRPLDEIKIATERIAKGDLDIAFNYQSNDEVGSMAKSFTGMSLNVKTMVGDIDYLLAEMAQGNFNVRTQNEEVYIGAYQNIILSLRKLRLTLRDTLTQIDDASVQVATSSDQVSSGAQALSQGAMEQASSIEELAATVNEALVHIKENAKNAQDANQLVIQAGAGVKGSNKSMKEMISAMGELSSISSEIEKIIKTIDEIAFQTNILALNAAVEAARAGEAGKGFAVVADEVRNLAQKSAEAANTTTMHIGSVLSAIQNSTVIANETAKSLEAVVDETNTAASKMTEIASASEQQAEAISQITVGIDQLSSVVQTNSATAEESAAASEELSGQAHLLQKLVGQFKL